jgi:hypothetical protein
MRRAHGSTRTSPRFPDDVEARQGVGTADTLSGSHLLSAPNCEIHAMPFGTVFAAVGTTSSDGVLQ